MNKNICICPLCGGEMDETYNGKQYCFICEMKFKKMLEDIYENQGESEK